jgi:hypothetical protein
MLCRKGIPELARMANRNQTASAACALQHRRQRRTTGIRRLAATLLSSITSEQEEGGLERKVYHQAAGTLGKHHARNALAVTRARHGPSQVIRKRTTANQRRVTDTAHPLIGNAAGAGRRSHVA